MDYKTYKSYKNTKNKWIRKIPNEWDLIKSKFCFKLSGGYAFKSDDFVDEGACLIRIGDIKNGSVDLENCKKLPLEYSIMMKEFLVDADDILIALTGATIGKIGQVPKSNEKILLNQRVGKLNSKYSNYYKYILNSDIIQSQIKLISDGSAQENISNEDIGNFEILKVDDKTKEVISNFLDIKTSEIYENIAKNKELITLLEEKMAALINQAVTKGLDSEVPMKNSGIEWLGEIPEHWENVKLKFLTLKIGSGKTPKGGSEIYSSEGIPLIRSQNIHFSTINFDDIVYISKEINNSMLSSIVKNHDILLNITGASIGRCNYIKNISIANVNQHVCIIRPVEKIHYKFLNYFLQSYSGQNQVFFYQNGISREGLNFEDISRFNILLPPYTEQLEIVSYLDDEINILYDSIAKIRQSINLLEEYKISLIHHVVTGKIDVRKDV